MHTNNSKGILVLLVVVGVMASVPGTALAANTDVFQSLFGGKDPSNNQNAPDQKQVQADQATAAQFQQAYQNDGQALAQAYEKFRQDQRANVDTTADRQNIQNLQSALDTDIAHKQANAQDLAKDGVANPYPVPADRGNAASGGRGWDHGSYGHHDNGAWQSNPQYNKDGRWQQASQYPHHDSWERHHRRGDHDNDNGQAAQPQ